MKKNNSTHIELLIYGIGMTIAIAVMLAIRYGEYLLFSDNLNGISFWEYLWLFRR